MNTLTKGIIILILIVAAFFTGYQRGYKVGHTAGLAAVQTYQQDCIRFPNICPEAGKTPTKEQVEQGYNRPRR